jgi:hypothetical protein
MQTETALVKPPLQVGGLDHLAVQAPCINILGGCFPVSPTLQTEHDIKHSIHG